MADKVQAVACGGLRAIHLVEHMIALVTGQMALEDGDFLINWVHQADLARHHNWLQEA